MQRSMAYERHLNLEATELRLGLPGSDEAPEKTSATPSVRSNKRASPEISEESRSKGSSSLSSDVENCEGETAPPAKEQIVGWPPIRSYRKNCLQPRKNDRVDGAGMYVKVSVDGAPYLRKIDLKVYKSYPELLEALEDMFKLTIGEYSEKEGYNGSDFAPYLRR
ncbi:hypothetical protein OIU76_006809 [Salix suchowensis]|nr:hypothetical protein OIU76_006809 [Salix suchowensis]